MSYLISISIGPVQDFIASARRSRDLWFGSWLLSDLSKRVAETIISQNGGELIFPSNLNGNVVNKILAVVPDTHNIEKNCRTAIETKLKDIYEKPIFDEIVKRLPKNGKIFYWTEAEAQILDMVEFYWAAYPYDENDQTIDETGKSAYEKARERVEILLNARKSTRNFEAVSWASNAPKSSLDGQRESVIEDTRIDDLQIQKILKLRNKERLCGVGILKRLGNAKDKNGNRIDSFYSTSHVASLPLIAGLGVTNFQEYKRNLENFQRIDGADFNRNDGQIVYQERLKEFFADENLKNAETYLKNFLKGECPNPYFALPLADGDRMGSVIDNQKNKQDHKALSEALSQFAANCKLIVEANNGCLVYAGGDDVLAFVPLHTVLNCARELAGDFKAKLSKNSKFVDAEENPPTLSVGVAVAHHIEPLQYALETMRRAEKEAKSFDPKKKNALAVVLSKRSGSDTTIKGSWKEDRNTGKPFDERLKWFIQLHLDDALPDGVAYEIRDLWLRFSSVQHLESAMKTDAVRILQRKRSNQGLSKVSREILDRLEGLILNKELSLEDLANEIIVARDFARSYRQAKKQAIGEAEL